MHRFVLGAFAVASIPLVLAGLRQLYLMARGSSFVPTSPGRVPSPSPSLPGRRAS